MSTVVIDTPEATAVTAIDAGRGTVVPLTSTLGARVVGLHLGAPLDEATVAWLRGLLLDHKALFFRGQHLTPTEQVAFARTLGELTPAHPLAGGLDDDHPEVLVLDSSAYLLGLGRRTEKTSYNDRWHTDVTFSARPPAASVLCAEVIPASGGDTLWCDLEDAYAALSPKLRAVLDDTVAFHTAVGAFGYLERQEGCTRAPRRPGQHRAPGGAGASRDRAAFVVRQRGLHHLARRLQRAGERCPARPAVRALHCAGAHRALAVAGR